MDSTGLATFTYHETFSSTVAGCRLTTMTVAHTIVAIQAGLSFTANPIVITQLPTVVTFGYPDLTKTMLATLGTTYLRVFSDIIPV
jgi:hypothetical protein